MSHVSGPNGLTPFQGFDVSFKLPLETREELFEVLIVILEKSADVRSGMTIRSEAAGGGRVEWREEK